jgi:hypothetical protein
MRSRGGDDTNTELGAAERGAGSGVPAQLCHRPAEPADPDIAGFCRRLLRVIKESGAIRDGNWS